MWEIETNMNFVEKAAKTRGELNGDDEDNVRKLSIYTRIDAAAER